MERTPIPAFVNAAAPSSRKALEAVTASDAFRVIPVEPQELADRLREAVKARAERVLVAGGDGTIATAASAVADSSTALAVVPVGTLNHFARDHGLFHEDFDVARLATSTTTKTVDIGQVNDRVFVNTSSVGAYVLFVRAREALERRHVPYRLASILAGFRLLGRIRPFYVEIEIDGVVRRMRTSILFVGVGERELQIPIAGGRVPDGRRVLHVIIVRGGTAGRLVAAGLLALARGLRAAARTPLLETFMTDRFTVDLPRPWGAVAVDGELVRMRAPLEYRLDSDAVRVVVP